MKANELTAMTREQLEEKVTELKISLPERRDILKPGYSAVVKIVTDLRDNAVIVPFEALRLASHKMPLKTKLITKNNEPKTEAGGEEA